MIYKSIESSSRELEEKRREEKRREEREGKRGYTGMAGPTKLTKPGSLIYKVSKKVKGRAKNIHQIVLGMLSCVKAYYDFSCP